MADEIFAINEDACKKIHDLTPYKNICKCIAIGNFKQCTTLVSLCVPGMYT